MIIDTEPQAPIELHELVEYLDANLDPSSEQSILAAAPTLYALSRNRRFLAEFLSEQLSQADFQVDNPYGGPVFLLARGKGYIVRVMGWPPALPDDIVPELAYGHATTIAHSHAFSLLTVGYFGPGYDTEMYEVDPESIRRAGSKHGSTVDLRFAGRYRLAEGTVLYYPAHRIAHIQYAPADYSISLNLIVKSAEDELVDQYFFDTKQKTLTRALSASNDAWIGLLTFAREVADPSFADSLRTIAASHSSSRIREVAAAALDRAPSL